MNRNNDRERRTRNFFRLSSMILGVAALVVSMAATSARAQVPENIEVQLQKMGHIVNPGSDLVVLIHYHGLGKVEVDQSSVGLYFAETPVTRSMRSIPMSTSKIDIPPGDSRHRITLRATVPADAHAYSVLPKPVRKDLVLQTLIGALVKVYGECRGDRHESP